MVKTATVGKSMRNKADRENSSKKEIKKATAVLKYPLTVPLKNKINRAAKRERQRR